MKNIILFLVCTKFIYAGEYLDEASRLNGHFSNNFQSSIVLPSTTEAKYNTIDKKQSFSSNITCEGASKPIASVSYSGTNDIGISVNVDMNGDGVKEKNYYFGGVSGICSDGLIKCDSGSWNNCDYFVYKHNANSIYLENTNRRYLSNCYCINNSCGSIAALDKNRILNDITATVYNIVQQQMSRFVLTKIENNNGTFEIYGESQDACKNYKDGKSNYSYSERDNSSLINEAEELRSSELDNPDSSINTVTNAMKNEDSIDYKSEKEALKAKASSIPTASESNKVVTVGTEVFDMSNMEDVEQKVFCQVQKIVKNGTVYTDGKTAYNSKSNNLEVAEYELRECIGNNRDVCPIDTGESVKYECGKVNKSNFNESVSSLGVLNSLAKDISCSIK